MGFIASEINKEHDKYILLENIVLCLAVGTALAAPLIGLLGMEAGGFHLFGDSRDGKSTAARIALSIWGNPAALMQTWTGTAHGFTNLANARNDGLLVLDEIGQANARQVLDKYQNIHRGYLPRLRQRQSVRSLARHMLAAEERRERQVATPAAGRGG